MKKVKIALWIIPLGIIGFVFYQNRDFFMTTQKLIVDIPFMAPHETSDLTNAVIIAAFFLAGLLVSYSFCLYKKFKANKIIKKLTISNESLKTEIIALKNELTAFTKQYATSQQTDIPDDTAVKKDFVEQEKL